MVLSSSAHINPARGIQHIVLEHKFEKGAGDEKNDISIVYKKEEERKGKTMDPRYCTVML